MGEQVAYVIRSASVSPAISTVPGDKAAPGNVGNILFVEQEIGQDRIDEGYERCLSVARKMIGKTAALGADYELEEITLKLALSAEVGLAFVGDASVEAAVEVKIKRVAAPLTGTAAPR